VIFQPSICGEAQLGQESNDGLLERITVRISFRINDLCRPDENSAMNSSGVRRNLQGCSELY